MSWRNNDEYPSPEQPFLRFPLHYRPTLSVLPCSIRAVEDFEYEGATVMMAPAAGFYSSNNIGIQEARIAYVLNQDSLKKAVKCLEEALKVYPGRID